MALDETADDDHDGDGTNTNDHTSKFDGLPSSSSVFGSGQQHRHQTPFPSSSSS